MDFNKKYDLLDPLPGRGPWQGGMRPVADRSDSWNAQHGQSSLPQSYRARQTATGREVTVHLLGQARTPETEALLARIRALPPASLAKLVEVGENQGAAYVVASAPPFLHLNDWLAQEEPASEAGEFTRMFERPVSPGDRSGAFPAMPASAAPPAAEPGEFTQMFQSPLPERTAQPEWPQPPPPEAPGEFTQFFRAPAPAPPQPVSSQPAPAPAAQMPAFGNSYPPPPAAGIDATGAFSASRPAAPAASAPPHGPSEYTMLISRPAPSAPAPPPPTQPSPAPPLQMPSFQLPQMAQVPQVPQMPQVPPFQIPQVPQMPQIPQVSATISAAPSANYLVYAIIALVSFLAGVGVTLLLKH
jgi:hypothetical protein